MQNPDGYKKVKLDGAHLAWVRSGDAFAICDLTKQPYIEYIRRKTKQTYGIELTSKEDISKLREALKPKTVGKWLQEEMKKDIEGGRYKVFRDIGRIYTQEIIEGGHMQELVLSIRQPAELLKVLKKIAPEKKFNDIDRLSGYDPAKATQYFWEGMIEGGAKGER